MTVVEGGDKFHDLGTWSISKVLGKNVKIQVVPVAESAQCSSCGPTFAAE